LRNLIDCVSFYTKNSFMAAKRCELNLTLVMLMKNLINFFFSFDKLMKEKLILPFFWLAVIATGLFFSANALDKITFDWLASIVRFFEFFVTIVLVLVFIRLICELAVAIFRINDNLSPDGGKSETANIDPMVEARKIAEAAAEKAREVTKTAGEKTKSARETMSNMGSNTADKTKTAANDIKNAARKTTSQTVKATSKTTTVETSTRTARKAPSRQTAPTNPASKPKVVKKTQPKTVKKAAATTGQKRGPKPGVKVRRDAQGRLLKKDGTLRAKPGPKK